MSHEAYRQLHGKIGEGSDVTADAPCSSSGRMSLVGWSGIERSTRRL